MALLWQQNKHGVNYEVRCAGQSVRLYTDDVFHSQYNPQHILTGHVWDLLMLPAFFYPQNSIKRVLVLGVGGGAAMHMLRHFIKPEKIIGIELNPQHIYIAKRFFKLRHKTIDLVEADAVSWLKNYTGKKFDMIIDDLFMEKDAEPLAVVDANRSWFSYVLKSLSNEGVFVRNYISKDALLSSAGLTNAYTRDRFSNVFQLSNNLNENYVGVYSRSAISSSALRKNLIKTPKLNPKLKSCRLRYTIRKLR